MTRFFISFICLWIVSLTNCPAETYLWTTIAGQAGVYGSTDGTNSEALFNSPAGMAIDKAGNIYVSDHSNQLIRLVYPVGTNWVVKTMVGSPGLYGSTDGTNSAARVNDPYGLGVDSSNNVFLADNYSRCVRKIKPVSTNWVISTIAGGNSTTPGTADGTNRTARFNYLTGLTVDSSNNIYVADTLAPTIRKIRPVSTNWVTSTIAGTPGAYDGADGVNGAAHFVAPSGLTADAAGNLFVVDTYGNTVRKMTPSGTNWSVSTIAGVNGVAGSADGTNNNALFNTPSGVAVDSLGNLYITDSGNRTIRKMTPVGADWIVTTIGGQVDTPGSTDGDNSVALFDGPGGIVVNSNGTIFVEDGTTHTIRQGILAMPPSIAFAPQDLTVTNGNPANFYVTATGTAPLYYQWIKGGTNLTDGGDVFGTTTTNLYLNTTVSSDANNYAVIVSNTWGVTTSSVAVLTIIIPPADSIGDGITDAWRARYFDPPGNTTNSRSCATCDASGTGQNNLFKFIAGLDPTNSASIFRILSTTPVTSNILVTWQAGGGRTNVVEAASNVGGSYTNVSGNFLLPDTGDIRTNFLDIGGAGIGGNRFYRIRIVP